MSHVGARYQVYKLAVAHGGLYPPDDQLTGDNRSVISSALISDDRSVISFVVVFQDVAQVGQFFNGVTLYLARNHQLVLLNDEGSTAEELTDTNCYTNTQLPNQPVCLYTAYTL